MSEEEAAFWRAIADEPWSHDNRLVFADWLDERGEQERAGWMRDPLVGPWMRPGQASPVDALLATLDSSSGDYETVLSALARVGAPAVPALLLRCEQDVLSVPRALAEMSADDLRPFLADLIRL